MSTGQRQVRDGPLWLMTLLLAGILIGGALIAYDKPTAQMFAVLGGVAIPPLSLLHYLSGRGRGRGGAR